MEQQLQTENTTGFSEDNLIQDEDFIFSNTPIIEEDKSKTSPLLSIDAKREAAITAIENKIPLDSIDPNESIDEQVKKAEEAYSQTSEYLKQVFSQESETPEEVIRNVKAVEEDHATFMELPSDAKLVVKNHDGDFVSAYLEYQQRGLASLAKSFEIVNDEGEVNWKNTGMDLASEITIPDTAATNAYFSKDFLERVTGDQASIITSIADLRNYYRSLDIPHKMKFSHDLVNYLQDKKDTLNGLEAIYLYDLITKDTDTSAAIWTTVDGVGDSLQVLGWIPVIGAGLFAVGGSIKAANRARKLEVLAKEITRSVNDIIEPIAKTDPKVFVEETFSKDLKTKAAKLGLSDIDIKRAVSSVSDIKDPELRAELIHERLKTEIALKNIETVINKDKTLNIKEDEIQNLISKAEKVAQESYGDVAVSISFKTLKSDEAGNTKAVFNVYRVLNKEGKKAYKQANPIEIPVTLSDITGSIDLTGFTKASHIPFLDWLASPVAKTKKGSEARNTLINSFRENLYSSNIIEKYLNNRFQQIAGTLGGKSKQRFASAIHRWTTLDETPTIDKLMEEGLTKKEAIAVRKYFDTTDVLYKYADKQLIAEAAVSGFMKHKTGIVKPSLDKESAVRYYNNRKNKYGKTILIETEGGIKKLKGVKDSNIPAIMDKLYAEGYVLTRSKDLIDAGDDIKGYWLLTKQGNLSDLPSSGLLGKVRNYTPLVVDGATSVIIKTTKVDLGGVTVTKRNIIGYTDTIEDMQYAEKFYKGKEGYEVYRLDQTLPSDIKSDIVEGLFTGKYRSERTGGKLFRLKFEDGVVKKVKPNYQDPLQAATRYVRTLARDLNFSPKILEEQKRFLNTLYLHANDPTFEPSIENFNRFDVEKALKTIRDDKLRSKLETAFEQIAAASNIAQDTQLFDRFAAALNDVNLSKAYLKPLSKLRRGFSDFVFNGNIASAVKGFTATMFLGLYNPRQFFMQASNIQNILAISPIHGAKAIYDTGILGVFDLVGTKEAIQSGGITGRFAIARKLLNQASNMKKEERDFYDVMLSVWARTGLRENIMANSDFFDVADKVNLERLRVGASSVAARMSESIREKSALSDPNLWYSTIFDGMFFYKAGESLNRRVAFATAFREAVDKYGLEKLLDESSEAYKYVVDRSHTLLFNMDVANRAPFQVGKISGTMLMFYQVATKTAEAFLGKDLTTAEKVRLMSAQFLMWGRKAVTPSRAVAQEEELDVIQSISESFGVNEEDAKTIYAYGLVGFFSKELFGKVVDLSETSSLQAAIVGNTLESPLVKMAEFITKGESEGRPFLAVASVSTRVVDAVDVFLDAMRLRVSNDIDTMTALEMIAKGASEIPSSTRNAMLASAILSSGIKYSSTGNPIYYVPEDQKNLEATLTALGISTEEAKIAYQYFSDEREHSKFVKEQAKYIAKQVIKASSSDKAYSILQGYLRLLDTLPESTQKEVIERVYLELEKDPLYIRMLHKAVGDKLTEIIKQQTIVNKEGNENED